MKYNRITAKLFGATASPLGNDPQIGQFGSAKAGTYIGTDDIATIQALNAWNNGFIDSVTPNTQFPPLPEVTGVIKVLSYLQCYSLQQGIPEYDSGTIYYEDNWCSYAQKLYICINDNSGQGITGVTPTDTDYWLEYTFTATGNIGEPQFTLDFTNVDPPVNCVWLNGDTKSKTIYANLYAIYGDNYWDGVTVIPDGEFQLPNFKGRTIWGGDTLGYIEAGLPNITGRMGTTDINGVSSTGCFYRSGRSGKLENETGQSDPNVYFDASRSSSIYGNSTTVQPSSIKVKVYTRYQ